MMRWLQCSYTDLMSMPEGYIEVAGEVAKKQADAARQRQRAAGRKR